MIWEKGRKTKRMIMASVVCIATGALILGGCGQDDDTGTRSEKPRQQETVNAVTADTERQREAQPYVEKPVLDDWEETQEHMEEPEGGIEKNSFADWEACLEPGEPGDLRADAIRGVTVIKDGQPYFAVSYEPRAYKNSFDCWAVSVPYQSMVAVDTEAMYNYFRLLAEAKLESAADVEREETGLDGSENTIYVAYFEGQTNQGGQAEPDRGILYRFGGQNEEGDYYVEAAGKVWMIHADTAEKLFAVNPYDYILKVVSVVSIETVSKVEIEFPENRHTMQTGKDGFMFDAREVDSKTFYELYTEIMSIFIEKELPEKDTDGIGRELLLTVTYHRNTKEAPKIIQRYYAYDNTYAIAQVNGTEFFLVSREALEKIRYDLQEA